MTPIMLQQEIDFNDACASLEEISKQIGNFVDYNNYEISLESLAIETVVVSMEENIYGSRPGVGDALAGMTNKVLNTVKDGAVNVGKKTGQVLKETAEGKYNLIAKAKAFLNKMVKFINTVSTALSKVLATGYPLMAGIRKRAAELKQRASGDESATTESEVEVGGAHKYLVLGDDIADTDEIIKALGYTAEVTEAILSKEKLGQFKSFSENVLEPYRDSLKQTKVDSVVMVMAVLSLLSNPGALGGAVLKRIFSVANPGLGAKLDVAAKTVGAVAGGVYGGVGALAVAAAGGTSTYLNQMSKGRLDISNIPHFSPIYSFCKNKVDSDSDLTVTLRSENMLGNRYWTVTDYVDSIEPNMKGSIAKVGGSLNVDKVKVGAKHLPALSKDQIVEICELVDRILSIAQGYCKEWPAYAKTYNEEYTRISDIVMTHGDTDGEGSKSITAHYVRYSYRNAMSMMLGGMWENSFGSDNKFIRYLVSLSKTLMSYCEKSLVKSHQADD